MAHRTRQPLTSAVPVSHRRERHRWTRAVAALDPCARHALPRLAGDPRGPYEAGEPASRDLPAASTEGAAEDPAGGLVDALGLVLGDRSALAAMGADALRVRVGVLRRLEGMVAAAMASTVRALEVAGGVAEDGASSTAAWIRTNTGRSAREAARTDRLGAAFDELPATAAALANGDLTAESADAVVHAARDGRLGTPDQVEATLLPVAVAEGPERVRAEARRRAQQVDGGAMLRDERRQHARRKVSLSRRDDGMWDLYGLLPSETGNRLRTLLDVFDTPDPDGTPVGQRRRPDQRLADALDTAADVALACGDLPATGGVARPHVSVVVDLTTFDADLAAHDDADRPAAPDDAVWAGLTGGQLAWGGTLSPQATRRICCDAGVSRIVTAGETQVLDVGRLTRQWSPAQRRAIAIRDRSCRGPDCGRPIGWTQIHHLQWWRHDGPTDLDNGLALCHHCHRLVHDRGWHAQLDAATAAVTWTSPDRRRTVVTHPRPPT